MATPNPNSSPIDGGVPGLETQSPAEATGFDERDRAPQDGPFWPNRAFYFIAAVAGVGCCSGLTPFPVSA